MTAILWGSALSPYFLKLDAVCRYAGLVAVHRPDGGSTLSNLRLLLRIKIAQRRHTIQRWPQTDPLDEYPLVPYLLTDDGKVHVDSSAIAAWLDASRPTPTPLIPDDPALAMVCCLIDEALDEIGLYLVHHHRWVVSRGDNTAGARLAREFRSLVPFGGLMAQRFSRRQTRRLPYLFSLAPVKVQWPDDGLPVPPGSEDYPATHARLELAWDALVDAATQALSRQRYLLGERFTLADAALYGQLQMNMTDPSSERRLRERSPALRRWLAAIEAGEHVGSDGTLRLHDDLRPLLQWIQDSFIPVMQANAAAYQRERAKGRKLWNEAAFERSEAEYKLQWWGAPARTVVKTFQVRVWRDLCERARALSAEQADQVRRVFGALPHEWIEPESKRTT